jgi:hypothetical protein
LAWVHQPARVCASPEWYAGSGVFPQLAPATDDSSDRLQVFLSGLAGGSSNLFARRETIDEYGWRNYGEVYADHEAAYYPGEPPVVSHYNNQYDLVYGALLQYVRSGDRRWFDLADSLARHVIDIDIYRTRTDRSAYNGGLFWHTDHYRDAATCTHRAYSRSNRGSLGRRYGGGPSNEHNYTTGLLHHYYLTGYPQARDTVIGLADWVINMDDGRLTMFGLIDGGPTGKASQTTEPDYHGPGRGSGNSVNALLDAWALTGRRHYLDKAEELIRRVIHPATDISALDLLDVERRWSYTVFLTVLARYLRLKCEAGEQDRMYFYARASLAHFARWMLDHEVPYFDHPEKLEYPTETWAAQEMRKANVLRLAAAYVDEPLRSLLTGRGDELAERAWGDLLRFPFHQTARAVAIMLTEGTRDAFCRAHGIEAAPPRPEAIDHGVPEVFVPQKRRVLDQLKTAKGLTTVMTRLLNPRNWRMSVSRFRQQS